MILADLCNLAIKTVDILTFPKTVPLIEIPRTWVEQLNSRLVPPGADRVVETINDVNSRPIVAQSFKERF